MKKEFACNGTVVSSADSDEEDAPAPAAKANDFGKVLQLQGDQRIKSKEFLIASGIVPEKEAKERIVVYVPTMNPKTSARIVADPAVTVTKPARTRTAVTSGLILMIDACYICRASAATVCSRDVLSTIVRCNKVYIQTQPKSRLLNRPNLSTSCLAHYNIPDAYPA